MRTRSSVQPSQVAEGRTTRSQVRRGGRSGRVSSSSKRSPAAEKSKESPSTETREKSRGGKLPLSTGTAALTSYPIARRGALPRAQSISLTEVSAGDQTDTEGEIPSQDQSAVEYSDDDEEEDGDEGLVLLGTPFRRAAANGKGGKAIEGEEEDDEEDEGEKDNPPSSSTDEEGMGDVPNSNGGGVATNSGQRIFRHFLDDLNGESVKLFKQYTVPHNKEPTTSTIREAYESAFLIYRRFYVDGIKKFIDWYDIVEKLESGEEWKPKAIMAAANITSLLREIHRMSRPNDGTFELFSALEEHFPLSFCPSLEDDVSGVNEEMLNLALDIRTQYVISSFREADWTVTISQVVAWAFWNVRVIPRNQRSLPDEKSLARICCMDTPRVPEVATRCVERVNEILRIAKGMRRESVPDALEEAFPLEGDNGFMQKVCSWASHAFATLQDSLGSGDETGQKEKGEQPVSRLETISEASSPASQAVLEVIRPNWPKEQSLLNANNIRFLKYFSESEADVTAIPFPDEEDDEPTPTAPAPAQAGTPRQRSDQRAEHPSPAGGSASATAIRTTTSALGGGFTAVNARKRGVSTQEDDDEGEDEFQEDARPQDDTRRAAIDRQAMPPPPKRHAREKVISRLAAAAPAARPTEPAASAATITNTTRPRLQQRQPPPSSRASIASGPPPSSRSPPSSRLQQRTPWSARDCDLLISLIGIYHCSWAEIARQANVQVKDGHPIEQWDSSKHLYDPRDQQAIRDKARNMKVERLREDSKLPLGFDGVILGKKEREYLITRGKNPDRREADVDDKGLPTYTNYLDDWAAE